MKKTKKKTKKKNNIKKIISIIIVIVLVLFGAFSIKKTFSKKKTVSAVKVVDKLDKYGYILEDNATKYYENLFKQLKTELSKESVNEEEYAKLVGQLFLADYFNLANKTSKNNVGGVQFIYETYQQSFTKKSTDEVYKYVESNIYGNRKQELPVVKSVDVADVVNIMHEYDGKTDEKAYSIELSIAYEKDMGYQTKATLVLIHSNDKLEIVKMS